MSTVELDSSGITFVGIRTRHISQMTQFAEHILGYEKTHDEADFVAFTTPRGQRLELFAEDTQDKQFYPLGGAVAGFEVPDFEAAVAWLEANQLEVFDEGTGEGEDGTRWAHFRGPDGNIYEFVHHPWIAADA